MARITIDRERCKGCLLCVSFCPKGLIGIDTCLNRRGVKPARFSRQEKLNKGGNRKNAQNERVECLGCAMCAIICPDCCIEVFK